MSSYHPAYDDNETAAATKSRGRFRPRLPAVGKKNWLFIAGEATGETSAILYTLIESAKRHAHKPYAYLKDVLERLPGMKASEVDALLPINWHPATAVFELAQAAS